MRKADIDVAWKELRSPSRAEIQLSLIEVSHETGIDSIQITSRVTAFIGTNGAGKTDFLSALYSRFCNKAKLSRVEVVRISGKFRGNFFEIVQHLVGPAVSNTSETLNPIPTLATAGPDVQIESSSPIVPVALQVAEGAQIMPVPANLKCEFIDASLEVHAINEIISSQSNFDEVLDQYESSVPTTGQIGLYRHVCGRHYEEISFKEVEYPAVPALLGGDEESDNVFPFFFVKVNTIKYDSRAMGLGEFCACYLVWKIQRANKGTILLLDEPDSHLSPASRSGLLDAVAFLAHEKKLWIAFTTHSIELLNDLRPSEIFLVITETVGMKTRVLPVEQRRHAVRTLGLSQVRKLLIVVEDVDAKEAVWCIINRWASDIAKTVDVQVVSGGEVRVREFITRFPQDSQICQSIAFLDGDKRPPVEEPVPSKFFYLPSSLDPVQAARELVEEDCEMFATFLGISPEKLSAALRQCRHVDHHDFLTRLLVATQLEGKAVSDIRSSLMKAWLFAPREKRGAEALAVGLTRLVDALL